jgi:hypothetical protein
MNLKDNPDIEAVKKAGPSVKKVKKYLSKKALKK